MGLFHKAGFEVVEERPVEGSVADLELIAALPPAPGFAAFEPRDLGIRSARLVFRKRRS